MELVIDTMVEQQKGSEEDNERHHTVTAAYDFSRPAR